MVGVPECGGMGSRFRRIRMLLKDEAGPGTVAYFAVFERNGDVTLPMILDRWAMKDERLIDEEGVP